MRLGILGTGKIVQEFLPWLAGPDAPFTVQGLCSTERSAPLAEELCTRYHIPQHTTNYLELLQWVDVVYLTVPNLQHTRYARVALEVWNNTAADPAAQYNANRDLYNAVDALYAAVNNKVDASTQQAINNQYNAFVSAQATIERAAAAYNQSVESYETTTAQFPANVISGLWGVREISQFAPQ